MKSLTKLQAVSGKEGGSSGDRYTKCVKMSKAKMLWGFECGLIIIIIGSREKPFYGRNENGNQIRPEKQVWSYSI